MTHSCHCDLVVGSAVCLAADLSELVDNEQPADWLSEASWQTDGWQVIVPVQRDPNNVRDWCLSSWSLQPSLSHISCSAALMSADIRFTVKDSTHGVFPQFRYHPVRTSVFERRSRFITLAYKVLFPSVCLLLGLCIGKNLTIWYITIQ